MDAPGRIFVSNGLVPVYRLSEPVLEVGLGVPAEIRLGTADIQFPSRLPVRLRGVPFDLTVELRQLRDRFDEFADADFRAATEVDRLTPIDFFSGVEDATGGVFHVEEFAGRFAGSPRGNRIVSVVAGLQAFADDSRDNMGGFEVEIVPRTVEVHRHQIDAVEIVLLPVGFRLSEERFLRDTVRGVCLFGVPVKEVLLAEGNLGVVRIRADSPEDGELLDVELASHLHELDTHDSVVVEIPAWILPVGADAADGRREVDDRIGPRFDERLPDTSPFAEVVVVASGDEHLDIVGPRAEFFDEMTPEKAAPAGHHHRPAVPGLVAHRQSTRPYQDCLLFAYQSIVCLIPSRQDTCGSQPVSSLSFS